MCGRYTAKNPNLIGKGIYDEFAVHGPNMPARYNIGPAQLLLSVSLDPQGKPATSEMKWGFVPFWDKSEKPKLAPINAKSEDALANRVFSQSLQKRRCLVPADGYYEWKKLGGDRKEPHHIQLKGGRHFYFAGIYERSSSEKPNTVAILTTKANTLTQSIHDRMPVILSGEAAKAWLAAGPITADELSRLSVPFPSEEMEEWPVSSAVGNVRNEGPHLVEPVPAGEMIVEKPSGEQLNLL